MPDHIPTEKQSLIGIAPIAKVRKTELRFNAVVELFTRLGNPWLSIDDICKDLGEKQPAIRTMMVQYKGAFKTMQTAATKWGGRLLYCMSPHITALPQPSKPEQKTRAKVPKAPSHSEGQGFKLPPGIDHAEMIPRDLAAMIGVAVATHLVWGNWEAAHEVLRHNQANFEALQKTPAPTPEEILDTPVANLGLPMRTSNALEEHGILTLKNLLHCRQEDLMEIPNFRYVTVNEILRVAYIWRDAYDRAVMFGRAPAPDLRLMSDVG